ncbi:MAG: hypothetical protein HKN68_17205 [Saprospiraceae bacterium]|nr:hypothetical protein [Saprospiraceae bacterium]
MSKIPSSIITELPVSSSINSSSSPKEMRIVQRNQLLLCFTAITLLTVCFIYSLQVEQFLISNKIAAYVIFAAWIFMKTNDPVKSRLKLKDQLAKK